MVALTGMGRRFHLAEQSIHLLRREPPPRAHRSVAGDGAADFLQPFLQRQRLVEFGEIVRKVAHQSRHIELAEYRRHFANDDRALPDYCGDSPPFSFFATAWDATCEGTTNAVHLNGSNWCAHRPFCCRCSARTAPRPGCGAQCFLPARPGQPSMDSSRPQVGLVGNSVTKCALAGLRNCIT